MGLKIALPIDCFLRQSLSFFRKYRGVYFRNFNVLSALLRPFASAPLSCFEALPVSLIRRAGLMQGLPGFSRPEATAPGESLRSSGKQATCLWHSCARLSSLRCPVFRANHFVLRENRQRALQSVVPKRAVCVQRNL